jgi:hypothetical protein
MPWLKLCATPRKRRQHVALKEHAVFIFEKVWAASPIISSPADLLRRQGGFLTVVGSSGVRCRASYFWAFLR